MMKTSSYSSFDRVPFIRGIPCRKSLLSTHSNLNRSYILSKRSQRCQDNQKVQTPRKQQFRNSRLSSRSSVRSQLTSRTQRGQLIIEGLEDADIYTICSFVDGLLEERLKWLVSPDKLMKHCKKRVADNTDEMSKQEVDSKLLLIDKILAETAVQAEILREKYFNLVNSRTTAQKFFNYNNSSENLKNLTQSQIINKEFAQSPSISIVKSTSYKAGFSTPNKSLISLWKQPKKKYSYNLFPVPSSTYNVNYRSKQRVVPYPAALKDENFNPFKQYAPRDMSSSLYTSDFSPKRQAQIINYKQQDCYQNKIKTLKIRYEPMKKLGIPMNKLAKLQKQYSNLLSKSSSFNKKPSFESQYTTTSVKDYTGIFKPKAVGKYDQLQKLKINYKNLVNFSKKKH